jgi:amino acid transporter
MAQGQVSASLAAATHAIVIVGVIAGVALINIAGIGRGTRLAAVITALKLIPLLVFVAAGGLAMRSAGLPSEAAHAVPMNAPALGRALILGAFAFSGMETALCASGEVQAPTRTIPRALAAAMLIVTTLYIAIQVVAQGILGSALGQSQAPLTDAMARVHPGLRALMAAGAAVSMLGWIATDILGTPRLLFAFARDGLLPRVLGRITRASRAPHVAILCYAGLAMALALSGTFAELAVLSELAGAALYVIACAAAWRLRRAGIARAGPPLAAPAFGAIAAVAIACMLGLIALAARAEIAGLAGLIGLAIAAYLTTSLLRRRVLTDAKRLRT